MDRQASGHREETTIDAWRFVRVGHVYSKLPSSEMASTTFWEAVTFEAYSLGVFLTFASILFPSAKIVGLTA